MEAQIMIEGRPLPYSWKRSARRRTVTITVHPEQGVVVHTPPAYSQTGVEKFLKEKSAWIAKHLRRMESDRAKRPRFRWVDGHPFPFRGRDYPLRLVPNSERDAVRLAEGHLVVEMTRDPGANGFLAASLAEPVNTAQPISNAEQDAVAEQVRGWFREQARLVIMARVAFFQRTIGVQPTRIRIRSQKRRWGSCSQRGSLNFNWCLILAPPEVMDYVIVHELCHLIEMNHSPRFWKLVAQVVPEHEERKAWLRENGEVLMV